MKVLFHTVKVDQILNDYKDIRSKAKRLTSVNNYWQKNFQSDITVIFSSPTISSIEPSSTESSTKPFSTESSTEPSSSEPSSTEISS